MKTIYNMSNLVQFGINPLTGEACAYGMRILCDLSADGVKLIRDFFGLHTYESMVGTGTDPQFPLNWNSMVGDKPAVASVMLPRGLVPDLMRFALFHVDSFDVVVVQPDGGMVGFNKDHAYAARYMDLAESMTGDGHSASYRIYRNPAKHSSAPSEGGRTTHAMTGRST